MPTIRIILLYTLYIATACGVTSGLNILHTKYVLNIELASQHFLVPVLAGVIFGGMLARVKIASPIILKPKDYVIFLKYIIFSCFITSALNIAHTEFVLHTQLHSQMFIAPLIAGLFFGYLLARIKILNSRLSALATTDFLTGAHNRLHFDEILEKEVIRATRYGGLFSIIFFDVDNFKSINDKYGHQAGDKALIGLVEIINTCVRHSDTIARYGGEEFIILSPETDTEGARNLAEQLRIRIENTQQETIGSLTCSFGVTTFKKGRDTSNSVLKSADKALYAAKARGKNRVVINTHGQLSDRTNFEYTPNVFIDKEKTVKSASTS